MIDPFAFVLLISSKRWSTSVEEAVPVAKPICQQRAMAQAEQVAVIVGDVSVEVEVHIKEMRHNLL